MKLFHIHNHLLIYYQGLLNVYSHRSFNQLSNTAHGEKNPNYVQSVYILTPAGLNGIFNKIDSQPVEWLSGNNHLRRTSAINLLH